MTVPQALWQQAVNIGLYQPLSLNEEGFLHAAAAGQFMKCACQFYAGRTDALALRINISLLTAPLRFEPGKSGTLYPHIYGALNVGAVDAVELLQPDSMGGFEPCSIVKENSGL